MELTKVVPLALILIGNAVQPRSTALATLVRVAGFVALGLNAFSRDIFSDMLVIVSSALGALIAVYSVPYSRAKYGSTSLAQLVDLFAASTILVFASRNLMEFIIFWLLSELLGFFLIAYDYIAKNDGNALTAAARYLIVSMIPTDVALFILLALVGFERSLEVSLKDAAPSLSNPAVLLMVILGFFAKAAVFPLHFWLPDAHSIAPSPASALLSGLTVKMGIYALYLLSFYPIDSYVVVYTALLFGLATSIYGAVQACLQQDIKRLLAYGTISDTSMMVVALALYMLSKDVAFLEAAVLYTVAHAVYKAFAFMDAGFVEIAVRERNVKRLGYVSRISPAETVSLMIATLSMFGMPPSAGFLAKLFLFTAISKHFTSSWIYVAVLVLASLKVSLSIVYGIAYLRTHIGGEVPEALEIDWRALGLRPATIGASLMAFLPTVAILLAPYAGYEELELVGRLRLHLALSAALFVAVFVLVHNFMRYRGGEGVGR